MAEKETLTTRVTRLEDAQLKTEERFQETNRLFQQLRIEADEREKRVDERIEKLVSAIGELIQRQHDM